MLLVPGRSNPPAAEHSRIRPWGKHNHRVVVTLPCSFGMGTNTTRERYCIRKERKNGASCALRRGKQFFEKHHQNWKVGNSSKCITIYAAFYPRKLTFISFFGLVTVCCEVKGAKVLNFFPSSSGLIFAIVSAVRNSLDAIVALLLGNFEDFNVVLSWLAMAVLLCNVCWLLRAQLSIGIIEQKFDV